MKTVMRRVAPNIFAGIAFLVWVAVAVPFHSTHAQSVTVQQRVSLAPMELLMFWGTNTYTPMAYHGKALPVPGSTVVVSVEAVKNGTLTSLGGQTVRWYLNDRLFNSGSGLQSVAIKVPQQNAGFFAVRVELPDATVEPSVKTITVPVVQPSVVIVAPFADATVHGTAATLFAAPYFFNMKAAASAFFAWTVDGEVTAPTEHPGELQLSLPGTGSQDVSVGLTATNKLVGGESARTTLNLTATQ